MDRKCQFPHEKVILCRFAGLPIIADQTAELRHPREQLIVAASVPSVNQWADENGDWLRNILYLSKSTTAIGCGACPPFHQTSQSIQLCQTRLPW